VVITPRWAFFIPSGGSVRNPSSTRSVFVIIAKFGHLGVKRASLTFARHPRVWVSGFKNKQVSGVGCQPPDSKVQRSKVYPPLAAPKATRVQRLNNCRNRADMMTKYKRVKSKEPRTQNLEPLA